jgi:hypothetical protein
MAETRRRTRHCILGGITAAGLMTLSPAAVAQAADQDVQRALQQRDAVIEQLQKRIEALEKRMRTSEARPTRAAPASTKGVPILVAAPATIAPAAVGARPAATAADAQPATAPTSPPTPAPGTTVPAAAEDEMIARALERTLVEQGAQLLPPYAFQLVPFADYSYQGDTQLSFVAANQLFPGATGQQLVTQRTRRDTIDGGLTFRLGLPWETQVNFRLPFVWSRGEATFAGVETKSRSTSGIGDISINLQKQVLHERGWLPDVLLNAFYVADTGRSSLTRPQVSTFNFSTGTGSGFNVLGGGITVLKRQDPLVFLGAFNYAHSFASTINGLKQQPGDAYSIRLSPILAASPDTSLRVAWDTTFQQRGDIGGRTVRGSDQVISFLEFGVGSVISRNLFVDASIAVGLTRDSPDFRAMVLFPYRF